MFQPTLKVLPTAVHTVIPIKKVAIFWVQNCCVYSPVIHKSWYSLDKLWNIWGHDPSKITCCYYFKAIKSDTISNNGYKMKVQKYVLNVHRTFTWGKPCRMKPHVLLLTCHPCNIYGSKTCSHGCIVVLVYCHETNPHPAVWNPHSSLEQDKESLQMLCMCPLLEHNHYALTIQIQLLDTAYSAQKNECQTLCLFYIKYWMGFVVEWNNITDYDQQWLICGKKVCWHDIRPLHRCLLSTLNITMMFGFGKGHDLTDCPFSLKGIE